MLHRLQFSISLHQVKHKEVIILFNKHNNKMADDDASRLAEMVSQRSAPTRPEQANKPIGT